MDPLPTAYSISNIPITSPLSSPLTDLGPLYSFIASRNAMSLHLGFVANDLLLAQFAQRFPLNFCVL